MGLIDDPWLPVDSTGNVPASMPAIPVAVYRFDEDAAQPYEPLPNVQCLAIRQALGNDPGSATFRYDLDPRSAGPHSAEEALSTASLAPGLVRPGDRLSVFATRPDGSDVPIFDGFALEFGMHLAGRTEEVTFTALGVAVRLRDTPLLGQLARAADQATVANADTRSDLPGHFNPRGEPNASPKDADSTDDLGRTLPVFYDPSIVQAPDIRRKWTLPMVARHLLFGANDELFVDNPQGDPAVRIDGLLVSREPVDGVAYDPEDPSTYTTADLIAADMPVHARDWPSVLEAALGEKGFALAYRLDWRTADTHGTYLDLFHPQQVTPLDLQLQPRGSVLDPNQSNVGEARLNRDVSKVVNAWIVEGALRRYEVSFILAPGFPMSSSDASSGNLNSFNINAAGFLAGGQSDAYRLYVLDECGEGHYLPGTSAALTATPDLSGLFGQDYLVRRRPPIGQLFSRDAKGKPFRARLSISTDYAGGGPGPWDGTGTWQAISTGGWGLLHDRMGIRITTPMANAWHIGKSAESGAPYRDGVVKAVEAQATTASGTNFWLRLTVVVEDDRVVFGQVDRSDRSPLPYAVTRRVDARDRYRYQAIAPLSEFNTDPVNPVVVRDDSDDAKAEAAALQAASEQGVLQGEVTIPYFTASIDVGARVRSIDGRGLGLRTDGGSDAQGAAVYPTVVARRWELAPRQRTVLTLSDAGTLRKRWGLDAHASRIHRHHGTG